MMATNNDQLVNIDNIINDDLLKEYIDENDYLKSIENKHKSDSLNKYDDFKPLTELQNISNGMTMNNLII